MMFRPLLVLMLLLGSFATQAASQNLATIRSYYVDFQSEMELDECRKRLISELEDVLISTTEDRRRADAIFVVKIENVTSAPIRHKLKWTAAVYGFDKTVLFQETDKESGWSIESSCSDAADDIAEELGDKVKEARVNRGQTPEPRYAIVPLVEPTAVEPSLPKPKVSLTPRSGVRTNPGQKNHTLREKEISSEPSLSSASQQPHRATTEPSKWRNSAARFAEVNGCSKSFSTVQSLPSGAEVYSTICGGAGAAIITCSSYKDCELDF